MSLFSRAIFPSLLLSFVVAGCAVTPSSDRAAADGRSKGVRVAPVSESLPWNAAWTAAPSERGGRWVAWYSDLPGLWLQGPDGKVKPLVSENDPEQAPSGLAIAEQGDDLWVAYRNKEPKRDVYLRREGRTAIDPLGVSEDTMALARLKLHATGDKVHALWYGERETGKQQYNIFLRTLGADGRPLNGNPEFVLPGIYPVWINDADGAMGVMSWVNDGQGSRIVSRTRRAGSPVFSEEVVIRPTTRSMTIPFDAFASGSRWFVYWVAQHGAMQDDFLIEGAWSDDQGATWTPFDLEAMRGFGVETVSVAADGANVVFALSLADRNKRADFREVALIRSEDNGTTWSGLLPVRDQKAEYARARAPKVAFLSPGRLFLMWEDWREIRSRVRYSVSEDAGRTWKVRDARLPYRDGASVMVNLFAGDVLPTGDGGVEVILEEMTDQYLRKALVSVTLDPDALFDPLSEPRPTVDGLQQKIDTYWSGLVKEEYKATYDVLDPFFRARVNFAGYLQPLGRVKYDSYKVHDIKLEGHVAHVSLTAVAGVPPYFSRGKLIEVPMQPRPIQSKWVWIDGEWFLEYFSEARGMRFTRY